MWTKPERNKIYCNLLSTTDWWKKYNCSEWFRKNNEYNFWLFWQKEKCLSKPQPVEMFYATKCVQHIAMPHKMTTKHKNSNPVILPNNNQPKSRQNAVYEHFIQVFWYMKTSVCFPFRLPEIGCYSKGCYLEGSRY